MMLVFGVKMGVSGVKMGQFGEMGKVKGIKN
jgi:hypothetical protein